jgi:hypothetical protein
VLETYALIEAGSTCPSAVLRVDRFVNGIERCCGCGKIIANACKPVIRDTVADKARIAVSEMGMSIGGLRLTDDPL